MTFPTMIWSQKRPAWLEAILELAKPILPAVVNTVLLAAKSGATMYQAMSIIIGCFIQMWICVCPKLSVVANLLQEALDPGVNPLGGSVLLQIVITALYSKLLEMQIESDINTVTTIAEGVCSIDEDDKHTEEIAELLKQADLHLESCKHFNFEFFTKIEEGYQMREVLHRSESPYRQQMNRLRQRKIKESSRPLQVLKDVLTIF
ncbi:uncharacterized protein LOC112904216 [Agrilus planipennis]|uniref:Uncharacterized protein LOC112904216 n=1 Tax=Agrilus planipennis TaxID=224129 RepID=A0A7F5R308_AGRPL|nr:uncharacterized protein LOC112904216 [Agrilus planipennis]